jgi:serine/threonine-protein kinase RsbW
VASKRRSKTKRADVRSLEPPRPGDLIHTESIPSDLEEKNPLIDRIVGVLLKEGFLGQEEDEMWTRLCLDEALVNAIRHGNKYDASKEVTVTVSASPAKWNVLIEDEGKGFKPTDVPDPEDPDSLLLEGGRGIVMMRSFMSRTTHYRNGAAVLLEKFQKRVRRRGRRRKAGKGA